MSFPTHAGFSATEVQLHHVNANKMIHVCICIYVCICLLRPQGTSASPQLTLKNRSDAATMGDLPSTPCWSLSRGKTGSSVVLCGLPTLLDHAGSAHSTSAGLCTKTGPKTASSIGQGPLGLRNAPDTPERLIERILADFCIVYLSDLLSDATDLNDRHPGSHTGTALPV